MDGWIWSHIIQILLVTLIIRWKNFKIDTSLILCKCNCDNDGLESTQDRYLVKPPIGDSGQSWIFIQVVFGPEQEDETEVVLCQLEKVTKMARDLEPSTWIELLIYIRENVDIFAWSSSELIRIPPQVSEHIIEHNPRFSASKTKEEALWIRERQSDS